MKLQASGVFTSERVVRSIRERFFEVVSCDPAEHVRRLLTADFVSLHLQTAAGMRVHRASPAIKTRSNLISA
jgi:hypothetical protein